MISATSVDRKLVLLRHAKSAWPDVPDRERPLARRGQRDAPSWALAGASGHVPDQVLCSTARRARETWQLVQSGLGIAPPVQFDNGVYPGGGGAASGADPPCTSDGRDASGRGSYPAIPELALTLAGTPAVQAGAVRDVASSAVLERMRAKFPTAAAAASSSPGTGIS